MIKKVLKTDLVAIITKAYFPEDFDYTCPTYSMSKFIKKQMRTKKIDLIALALTATNVLEQRENKSNRQHIIDNQ
ncbi:hypothetical protein LCGC14_2414950 [marine sediment metagenome]|uniref:Uncharacterized protein n=1 Tax=marine sediment metagenome TaxID=412755 RepID=A0A0F9CDK2_9ZZZZ